MDIVSVEERRKFEAIVVRLTYEEACVLCSIFYKIGGCVEKSRRKLTDGIYSALKKAGAVGDASDINSGSIYFKSEGIF